MDVHNPDNAAVNGPPMDPIQEQMPESAPSTLPDAEAFVPPERGKKTAGGHKLLILLILVLLIAAGGAAYWFHKHKKAPIKQAAAVQTVPTPSRQIASGSSVYMAKGQDLNLSFSYPNNWAAAPANGSDTNDQPISITSPLTSLVDAKGQTVTAKVVVSIRPVTSDVSELSSNNPTEALDSTQFAYTAPTTNQHQYPFLSYVHFSNGQNIPGAFEEVFVTGVQQLLKGYPVQSIGTDPIISASMYQCTSQDCTDKGAAILSITLNTWQNSDVTKQVQNVLASLKFN